MTRNHSSTSFGTSCLRMPINPYNQQPSPSYERTPVLTSHTEEGSSFSRKQRSSCSPSRPASRRSSPVSKQGVTPRSHGPLVKSKSSPLDSFLDFYESIPDYREVTHLSDREFADKMKRLRDKQRQYLQTLGGRYSPVEFEECRSGMENYAKKSCRGVNKLELAKEWVNKSCDTLSSLSKKSDNDFRIVRNVQEDSSIKKASSANHSPRKHSPYDLKDDMEGLLMDTGSSLSTDSNLLKTKLSQSTYAVEEERKRSTSSNTLQGCETQYTSPGRTESCHETLNSYRLKENGAHTDNFYNLKDTSYSGQSSIKRKGRSSSCVMQSSGTSELNIQDCSSPLGIAHHDILHYEDYYVPTSGWLQSDSDSMLGTMNNIPSTRPSTMLLSQSLPGSPTNKRTSSSSKPASPKKKTCRKRRLSQKSLTKPVPFSFMRNDRPFSRSTPDLSNHCHSPSPKHFRARPIPRNLFSNYVYQKKQEEEFFRALKRKVRAEEMLRAASMPPSMEFRERLSRVQAEAAAAEAASLAASLAAASSSSDQSGPGGGARGSADAEGSAGGSAAGQDADGQDPDAADADARDAVRVRARGRRGAGGRTTPCRARQPRRRPPDFAKCHEKMRKELNERQSRNITTSPSPYSLRTSSLSPRRKGSSSSGCSDSRRCRPRPHSSFEQMTTSSRSNLAALLRIQTARQRLEAEHHRLREEQARRAEMRLREKLTRLTPAWRSIQYSTEEDLALRAAARRHEERLRRAEHGVLMRHMLHRVHAIPTLFERQSYTLPGSPCSQPSPPRSAKRSAHHSRCSAGAGGHAGGGDAAIGDVVGCGPSCSILADLDEDAADVRVFVPLRSPPRSHRPSRPRQRPCSAGVERGSRGHPSRLEARLDGGGRPSSVSPGSRLHSPDRASSRLRHYHRQLPHHQHRVEFAAHAAQAAHAQDCDEDVDDGEEVEEEVADDDHQDLIVSGVGGGDAAG